MKFKRIVFSQFIIGILCSPVAADTTTSIEELKKRYEVKTCIACHEENGKQWSESLHARSLATPQILESFNAFIREDTTGRGSGAESGQRIRPCMACHAPQTRDASASLLGRIQDLITAAVESPDLQIRETALKELSAFDVNCRVCHMIKGNPENISKPKTIYGPGWDEDEISHKREYGYETVGSDYLMSSGMCSSCHKTGTRDSHSPSYLKYHSHILLHYQEATKDGTCQHCHMHQNKTAPHSFRH